MVVIQSNNNYIFGGYNSQSWNTVSVNVDKNFLFTLVNPHNTEPKKFRQQIISPVVAYNNITGPKFGDDLTIVDQCDSAYSSIGFPQLFTDTTSIGANLFTGSPQFLVKEIEIFEKL